MTTIRVLFLTSDSEYCHRLSPYFAKYHPEIKPAFSASTQGAVEILAQKMYNVVLIGEEFENERLVVPNGTAGAYLTETASGNDINGLHSFCKYKSGDALYRIILSMFAEVSSVQLSDYRNFRIFAFAGANGGAGATTLAAALAYRLASLGKKTLYFSCDPLADYSGFLSDNSEGGSLSDMIFIVKSGTNIKSASLKAAALLKNDISGVKFLDSCKEPYDFETLKTEHIEKMLEVLSGADEFDCIVVDGSIYDARFRELAVKKSDKLFVVAESDANAQKKLSRLIRFLKASDKRENTDLILRSALIFNKNSGAVSGNIEGMSFCGSVPRYKDTNIRNIASAASRLNIWDNASIL